MKQITYLIVLSIFMLISCNPKKDSSSTDETKIIKEVVDSIELQTKRLDEEAKKIEDLGNDIDQLLEELEK